MPDLIAFGKKSQACGVMAGRRMDEVPDNVFRLSGRINSTWGGNLVDMTRSRLCLEIIEQEKLIANAETVGREFLEELHRLADGEPVISAVRGRGLLLGFNMPNRELRDRFYRGLYEAGLVAIRCGERSIRFRPALDFPHSAIAEAIKILTYQCSRISDRQPAVFSPAPPSDLAGSAAPAGCSRQGV